MSDDNLLQETHDAVMEIQGDLRMGNKRFDDIEKKVEAHHNTLFVEYAKGRPGLVEAVGDQAKFANAWNRLAWLLIGAMISTAGGAVVMALRH